MIKILLTVFVLIPFGFWLGRLLAAVISLALVSVSMGLGNLIHRAFKGKTGRDWEAPLWLGTIHSLVFKGLIYGSVGTFVGVFLGWGNLFYISVFLSSISTTMLTVYLFIIILLSSIHGKFNFFGDN